MSGGPTPALRFAYGTNGLGDHRLDDALAFLADEGYDGVALTLDHATIDPFADDVTARVAQVRRRLEGLGLAVVVETGARFLLDPRRKHEPTLVSRRGVERRLDLYARAARIAVDLGAPVLHLWSGVADPVEDPLTVWTRLVEGVRRVLEDAEAAGVDLAFEPEPGMVVDTLDAWDRLADAVGHHPRLRLTLDVGHCRCLEPQPEADCVRRVAGVLAHVQIEDMHRGVHEHLPLGEGEVDVPGTLAALVDVGYDGLVSVELTRHAHTAHTVVPASLAYLRAALPRDAPMAAGGADDADVHDAHARRTP